MKAILETERTFLREMTHADYGDLCEILQDSKVIYAYEHIFSNDEVNEWLERQIDRYANDGIGLWGVISKDSGDFIGQVGLTLQNTDREEGLLEIGYLLKRRFWHCGYATETALARKDYAFNTLKYNRVVSIIRDNNYPSQNVAKRVGMTKGYQFIKHYRGIDMPHVVYNANR